MGRPRDVPVKPQGPAGWGGWPEAGVEYLLDHLGEPGAREEADPRPWPSRRLSVKAPTLGVLAPPFSSAHCRDFFVRVLVWPLPVRVGSGPSPHIGKKSHLRVGWGLPLEN